MFKYKIISSSFICGICIIILRISLKVFLFPGKSRIHIFSHQFYVTTQIQSLTRPNVKQALQNIATKVRKKF